MKFRIGKAEFLSDVTEDKVRKVRFAVGLRERDIECIFTFSPDELGMLQDRDDPDLSISTTDDVIFYGIMSEWRKRVKEETDAWDAFYSYLYRRPTDGDAFFALDKSWSLEEFEDYLDECREKGLVKISSMGGKARDSQLFCEVKIGDLELSLLLKTVTARGYGRMVFFTRSDGCYAAVRSTVSKKSASIFGILEDKLDLTYVLKSK